MVKLFVVGYPLDIQDAELIEIFSIHGIIHSIQLLTDKNTGKHKGYGFVEMVDQMGAERAIAAVNGMVIKGRKITVKMADEDRVQKPRSFIPNRFPIGERQSNSEDVYKTKRPRKLVSNTFRADQ